MILGIGTDLANIDLFAAEDYDVIVTVGFAIGQATAEAAATYPDIDFIGVDQFQAEPVDNVAGLIFNEDKAGFAAGALVSLGAALGGTLGSMRRAATLPPAESMRPPAPPLYRRTRLSTSRIAAWLDQPTRIILRQIVRWPGRIKPGTVIDEALTSVDFLPTVLDLMGLELPPERTGESLIRR